METGFIYLVIIEFLLILLVIGIKLLFNYIENKKIKSILKYIDKQYNSKKDATDIKIKECFEAINQSDKELVK